MKITNKKKYMTPNFMKLGKMKIVTQGGASVCNDNTNTKETNAGGQC